MGKTTLAVDGHVHLYANFDLTEAVTSGRENLLTAAAKKIDNREKIITVWLMVERSDTSFFDKIKSSPEKYNQDDIRFVKGADDLTIQVEKDGQPILYIFAGRQLVTKENLEVLSLISDLNVADKTEPIGEVIKMIQQDGGIPTLNWAPGKWFFQRGEVIKTQIERNLPDAFFIGETTLRHTLWRKPVLIKKAEQKGFRVIAGSDPLPFKGEEKAIGSFGFVIEGNFDEKKPAESIRKILKENPDSIQLIGKRNNIFNFTRRQMKIMIEKRQRKS